MKSLKLNILEQNQLSSQEMTNLQGGEGWCGCACAYADNGGSSIANNGNANSLQGVNLPDTANWQVEVKTTVYL